MSKKQELAKITSSYPVLDPASDIAEAMKENFAAGETLEAYELTKIAVPSQGVTNWTWEDISGEHSEKEIKGVLVCVLQRGTLWPSDDPSNSRPVLVTDDMVKARKVGDDLGDIDEAELERCKLEDGHYDWQKLSYTQFGSGKNGVGKRAKESRVLFILRPGDAWPVIVQAGPGSLKDVRKFLKMLPVPHYRAVVSLTLKKDENSSKQAFSKLVPHFVEGLDKEAGQLIKKLYTTPIRQSADRLDD